VDVYVRLPQWQPPRRTGPLVGFSVSVLPMVMT
jgi:hypothetical protein